MESELRAVGVLKSELAVADDSAAVQCSAGDPWARSERPVGVDDRSGAVRIDILDDQRRAGIGVPGPVAPGPEKAAVRLWNRRGLSNPVGDALVTKNPARLQLAGGRRLSPGSRGR